MKCCSKSVSFDIAYIDIEERLSPVASGIGCAAHEKGVTMVKSKWAGILLGIIGGIGFSLAGWIVSFALAKTSLWAVSLFAALLFPFLGLGILSFATRKKASENSGSITIAYVAVSFAVEAIFFLVANVAA